MPELRASGTLTPRPRSAAPGKGNCEIMDVGPMIRPGLSRIHFREAFLPRVVRSEDFFATALPPSEF
jgi:hypothetical protein